ncbi:MAG: UDP-N-acetylmuramate dehydrogenase [Spirochaetales bacterium]|nr:UDP-N-acetylmuramate dehydrogenase [Spirochaetales bacterium]
MSKVRENLKRINIEGSVVYNEPMAKHTTFRVGGPAEVYIRPKNSADVAKVVQYCRSSQTPLFVLGGGANILVSDKGISGIVLAMESLHHISLSGTDLLVQAGAGVSEVSAFAAERGLGGFEFIYSMPGSFGGAVWMNARCYGSEVAEVLREVTYLDTEGNVAQMYPAREEFSYKDTPFMKNPWIILEGKISLTPADPNSLWKEMKEFETDRRTKGHFDAPCAGSVFKNNRDFGAPSGQIIDRLGLRGTTLGGAQISPIHGNIIINQGNARAQDIGDLIDFVQNQVHTQFGFHLEPEVIRVGDWT